MLYAREFSCSIVLVDVHIKSSTDNRGHALLMTANKPETALYRAPTFSLLLASHGGSSCAYKIKYC